MGEQHRWADPAAAAAAGMAIARHAELAPDRMAIDGPLGRRTFHALNTACNQLARALRARGLAAGDAVALLAPNGPGFVEAHYACFRAGLRLTPINWHLVPDEVAYVAADCEAKALIADIRFADAARHAAEAAGARVRLAIGGAIPGFASYDRALAAESGADLDDPVQGFSMLYTSGTTGRPKGVFRRAAPPDLLAAIVASAAFDPVRDVALVTGPLYHAAPLRLNLHMQLTAGLGVVLMDKWTPEETLALVERHGITHTHMVPTMIHRLLALDPTVRSRHDISTLRWLLHGAAPSALAMKKRAIETFGPILWEYYAGTEGGGTFVGSEDWLSRPGTVGRAVPGVRITVHDDGGREMPAGTAGRVYIHIRPEHQFTYFKDPDKTAGAFRGDAFTMGDIGFLDADGYLFLSGRSAETIVSGGVNIYPAEIDAVLHQHPAVFDVCTVGAPDEEWGEQVVAVVQPAAGLTGDAALAEALAAFCRGRMAAFKIPRRIEFVDDLPRLETGKILRRQVRERFWRDRDRQI